MRAIVPNMLRRAIVGFVCAVADPSSGFSTEKNRPVAEVDIPAGRGTPTTSVLLGGGTARVKVMTGSDRSCVSSELRPLLGNATEETYRLDSPGASDQCVVYEVPELKIGSFAVRDQRVVLANRPMLFSRWLEHSNTRLDGFIGSPVFNNAALQFDVSSSKMRVYDRYVRRVAGGGPKGSPGVWGAHDLRRDDSTLRRP